MVLGVGGCGHWYGWVWVAVCVGIEGCACEWLWVWVLVAVGVVGVGCCGSVKV